MKKFVEVKSYKNFIAIPELSLKPRNNQIPDLTVYKTVRGIPTEVVLLVEICNAKKIKDDTSKLTELMQKIQSVKEAIVIDKDNLDIYKIKRAKSGKPTIAKKDSKIDIFKIDISNTVKSVI